jgi:hypothetical protein
MVKRDQKVYKREELQGGMREVGSNEGFLSHMTDGKLSC